MPLPFPPRPSHPSTGTILDRVLVGNHKRVKDPHRVTSLLRVSRSAMDVNGSDGDTLPGHERQDLQSCSSEGLDNDQFDAPRVDQKQTATRPQRARFPCLNQPLQRRTQSQPQQHPHVFDFIKAINTIRCESRNSKPRQPENARAYTTTRTLVPPPISIKHDVLSREREPSVTASVANVGLEIEDLTMKVIREKKALKAELVQTRTHAQNLTRRLADVEEELGVSLARNDEKDKHIETLKHELLSAKATSDSNQRDLVSTKEDLISVRNQNVVLASTNQKLEGVQGHVKAKLDAMQNAHAKLLTSLTDLKILHDSATARISNLSDGVAECRKSANNALTKFETTYQDSQTTQLRGMLADLRDTLSECKSRSPSRPSLLNVMIASRTNDLLRDKLHHHLGQIVELNDRIKELESEKRELLNLLVVQKEQETAGQKLGMMMEELSDCLAKREAEVEIATADAVTLKVELRASESRIPDLHQQIADDAVKLELLKTTQQECDGAKKALAANDDRLITLEQPILLTTDECLGNVENELALARMEIDSGNKLTQQLQAQVSHSRTALSLAAKDAEMAQLRAASDLEQALKARQETIMELKHTISVKAGEYKSVEASLEHARRELSGKETLLEQRNTHFNKLEERFDAQGSTLRLSKEQCGDLQEQLQISDRNLVELKVEMARLQQQLEKHQDTVNELKAVKGLLAGKDLARAIDDLRDLQGRYDTQTKDLLAITMEQALLSADRKNLEKELETHKGCLAEKERL
ncbi:hypothetical protein APHAL10511_003350 [Amanita phalloides]|nr:hypothetical protein APHAL10511_003350 [Amanita phalloides]